MTENLPIATVLSEMDQIQTVMRTTPAAYFKDEGMQSRYRSLVEMKSGAPATVLGQDTGPLVQVLQPKDYAAVCKQQGVTPNYSQYLANIRKLSDLAFAIPQAEQRAFVNSFDRLPEKVQLACMMEVLARVPSVVPTSSAIMQKFAKEAEGAVLVREWGHHAPRNHAICRERVQGILYDLLDQSESLAKAFVAWFFDTLTVSQRTAIYRKMAA